MSDSNSNNTSVKKEKRGYLRPNDKKLKDKSPDYIGKFLLEGKEWRISMWNNIAADGQQYYSISLSEPLVPEQVNTQNNNNFGGQPILRPEPTPGAILNLSSDQLSDLDEILNLTDDKDLDNPNPFDN